MWPAIAAIGGSAISAIGGAMSNSSNRSEAKRADLFSRENYRHQHQWEVQDLRKAGLNPILSAHSGNGFSTVPMATQDNPFDSFDGIGDTLNNSRKIDEIDKEALKIQNKQVDAQIDLAKATAGAQDALKNKSASEQHLADEQAAFTRMQSINTILQRPSITAQADAIAAAAARDQSTVRYNSALETKAYSDRDLVEREKRAGKYEEKTQQYTRPIRDVIDTLTSPIRGLWHKTSTTVHQGD